MEYLVVIIVILLATVALVGVGDRFNLPWPVLLTLLMTGLIFIPHLPHIEIDAEIILPIFLPPLLWAIGARVSWGALRRQWKAVLIFSILLTAITAFAVAWTAWVLVPGMSFALALAIGAAIAPPDPVAVEAVAEPVGIPRRIVGVLQTEGLFNDAVSLVLFQAALAVVVDGGELNSGSLILSFALSIVLAVGIGLLIGYLANFLARSVSNSALVSSLTLIIPFAAYIIAEHFHASGVIAVVIAAVHSNSIKQDEFTAEDRIFNNAFWQVVELLVTGMAFGLIGLQAGELVYAAGSSIWVMVLHGVVISAVTIGVRLAWLTALWLINLGRHSEHATPRSFAEVLVMTWAGMRGLVTLALTLTLPVLANNMRTEAIIVVITALVFTMVFPGLTLPLLVRLLGVSSAGEQDDREEEELLRIAQIAALKSVKEAALKDADPQAVARAQEIFQQIAGRYELAKADTDLYKARVEEAKRVRTQWHKVRDDAVSAAQSAVLAQRNHYDIDVVNTVLCQLDMLSLANTSGIGAGNSTLLMPTFTTGILKTVEKHRLLGEKEHTGTAPVPTISPQITASKKHDLG